MLVTVNHNATLCKAALINTPASGVVFVTRLHITHVFVPATDAPRAGVFTELVCYVVSVVIVPINVRYLSDAG